MKTSKEELINDKRLVQAIIKLHFDRGYQELISQIAEETEADLKELADLTDPDKILLSHAKWKNKHSTLAFLKEYPQVLRQQYIETYEIEPEFDDLVN